MPEASLSTTAPQSSQVKSAMRTLDIIEYVVGNDRALVAQEIATALGIPVSSLSYLLGTLVEREYLVRDGRRYSPGPGLQRLQTDNCGFTLAERAAPLVRTLRIQLDETTSFLIRRGWECEAIVTETSEQALRYSLPTGERLPMHAMASGKAILATLPDEELDLYFAETTRERFTPATITAEGELRRQIEAVRETGFGQTDEERSLGICGLGCVVMGREGVIGSFSVAIPKVRMNAGLMDRAKDMLRKTCALLADR